MLRIYLISAISLIMSVSLNAQSYQFLNATGKKITEEKFNDFKHSKSTFLPVKQGELWGILDTKKGLVINCEYQDIKPNPNNPNLFAVKKGELWGIINASGTTLLPFEYDEIKSFDDELAIVSIDFYWVLVNFKGEKLVNDEYEKTSNLYALNGRDGIWFEKKGQFDLYNRVGKKLFTTQTGWISIDNETTDNRLQMVTNGWHKTGVLDIKTEKIVVPLQYDKVKVINEDLVEVAKCKIEYDGFGPSPRPSDFLYGVYSASLQKEIAPCTFDEIVVKEKYIQAILKGYKNTSSYYSHQGQVLNPENLQASAGIEKYDFPQVLPMSKTAFAVQTKDRKWGIVSYENDNLKWKTFPRGAFKKVENVKAGETLFPFVLFIGYSYTEIYDTKGEMVKRAAYPNFEKVNATASTVTYKNYDTKTGKVVYFELSKDGKITEKTITAEDNLVMPFQNADKKYGLKKTDGTIVEPAVHQSIRTKKVNEQTIFIIYN